MKNTLFLAILTALALASCGDGTISPPNPTVPDDTVPDGTATWTLPSATSPVGSEMNVGKASLVVNTDGGSMPSYDGLVRLIVPPGAINWSYVYFTPVTSEAPNTLGLTYRLEVPAYAAGQVNKPLSLEFEVSPNESSSDFVVLRQDKSGKWQSLPQNQVQVSNSPKDSTSKTVRVPITTDGDYALAARYKLYPSKATLQVNASLPVTVVSLSALDPNNLSDLEVKPISVSTWAVNGTTDGNASLGKLIASDRPNHRTYKAPAKKPSPNPVRVSATVGQKTYFSSIKIVDTDGWMDFFVTGSVRKTYTSPTESLNFNADVNAQWKFDSGKTIASPPTVYSGQPYPGYYTAEFLLEPNSVATANIRYKYTETLTCICTPKSGSYQRITEYEFTAADSLKDPSVQSAFLTGEIQSSGNYAWDLGGLQISLEGDYSFKRREVSYPCGDRQIAAPIERSGKDTVKFVGKGLKISGTLKPQGPDSSQGMDTDHKFITIQLPQKGLLFSPIPATSIYSWFLKYLPIKINTAPIRPQSAPFSSPAAPHAEEAAGIKPQPRC